MEGESGSTRLASHQEEIKEAREGSRRLKNEEKNDTLSKDSKRLDEGRAEKAKAARAAKIALIVKTKGRQTNGLKDTQVGNTNTVHNF